jgi:hypothetical protein
MRSLSHRAVLVVAAVVWTACQTGVERQRARIDLVEARPTTDVAGAVAAELVTATRDHKHLVVYVGASWCEPCRYFHDAAVAGALDTELGDVRLVAFDLDRDGEALRAAGYASAMIPLFAIPRSDGHASGEQIAGSIKGSGAARQIAPRLRALVDGRSAER